MKIGFRVPSIKKRIAARTSIKRIVRNELGLKVPRGWGWLTNPKKADYNRIYNRTSIGCLTYMIALAILLVGAYSVFARGGGHSSSSGAVHVNGYFKSNGTYVQPHYRSAPDGNFNNNWSTKGNVNPYTGKQGTKTSPPDGYKGSSSGSGTAEYINPENNSGISTDKNEIPGQRSPPSQIPPISDKSYINSEPTKSKASKSNSSIIIPANAKLNYRGNGWECNRGYVRRGDACDQVYVPDNAKLNYSGHGWVCNRGYVRHGDTCETVNVPQNARLNHSGHSWECNRGYTRYGDVCETVTVPQNAKLNYSGHGWVCNRGFMRRGDACIQLIAQ